MHDDELRRLQDDDEWDAESAVYQPPRKTRRAVVSVAFPSADFQLVATVARAAGQPTSQFIREAAVERARRASTPSGEPPDSAVREAHVYVVRGTLTSHVSNISPFLRRPPRVAHLR